MQRTHTQEYPHQANEAVLWKAFKEGDRAAFAELVELYYPQLLNYGVRFQRDREFVKDCLHDLLLELWNRRQRLDDVHVVKVYLLKSLRRKVLKESTRLKWFREAHEVSDDYAFEVQFAIETYLISREVQHEDLVRLRTRLERLTKRQREAIYLRFYQDLDYDAIAGVMSIQVHSAVNLVYEALKLLRRNWFLSLLIWILPLNP
ncbi:RNA polymerase sigma factor [Siphonobacter aquaeclarae]|jgi:RNA polymerase sigma factor (sigma-70 family)|uniref:RNA polymerase sigma factor, sigma-70 family n=1 Tax=Siphonobacter aquaeclarae TaxID=563176 RepID=A0A1G9HPW7_9BACT|nr:sigma-70 family RNA polymerase sigma factor [Siphonobacter aquaeclarae]MBO9641469.1 sigma-70 family RNA polymerase sigma factor [Siphonobacter aquaeclarae]SDL14892.1 RNA polymerase sigma factor, sigma-70 family [Siphonobacter aquaeclarae]